MITCNKSDSRPVYLKIESLQIMLESVSSLNVGTPLTDCNIIYRETAGLWAVYVLCEPRIEKGKK